VQSAALVHAFPSGCRPQVPSMQSPERHIATPLQGIPSAWPQTPAAQTSAAHSWLRTHCAPFGCRPQTEAAPHTPAEHSWSRMQGFPSASGPQSWVSVSHTPAAQSPSLVHASPVVFPCGATQ
jgi:hypothetical protein